MANRRTSGTPRSHDRKDYWLEHIRRWERSGRSQAEYCRENGLNPQSFSSRISSMRKSAREEHDFVELTPMKEDGPLLEIRVEPDLRITVSVSPKFAHDMFRNG
jgi:hypothetical protein